MERLDDVEWLKRLRARATGPRTGYRAMYSTWWDGLVTDPALMVMAIDDHQVHRGDAVFEAIKFGPRGIYLAKEHLDRLERSAAAICLAPAKSRKETESVLLDVVEASGLPGGILRVFLGRGPGSFTANPYESVGTQLAVIATEAKPMADAKVERGVSLALSKIPAKEAWQARIKSCNYLPNVLMKKEAVDLGVDFTVALGANGELTEGSTENVLIVDRDGRLARPRLAEILAGTMMLRAFELADDLVKAGMLDGVDERDLTLDDLRGAREVLMAGTTLDVIAVTQFAGQPIGDGLPGPIATELRRRLQQDQDQGGHSLRR